MSSKKILNPSILQSSVWGAPNKGHLISAKPSVGPRSTASVAVLAPVAAGTARELRSVQIDKRDLSTVFQLAPRPTKLSSIILYSILHTLYYIVYTIYSIRYTLYSILYTICSKYSILYTI